MRNNPKDILRWAQSRGWTVDKTSGGHWRLRHPNGSIVFASNTPGDWRAEHNMRAKILRAERSKQ